MFRRLLAGLALLACLLTVASVANARSGVGTGKFTGSTEGDFDLSFTVAKKGKSIVKFKTAVVTYCRGGLGNSGPTVKGVSLPRIKVEGNGGFDQTFRSATDETETAIRVSGKIAGSRLKSGKLTYELTGDGTECVTDGPQALSAKRK